MEDKEALRGAISTSREIIDLQARKLQVLKEYLNGLEQRHGACASMENSLDRMGCPMIQFELRNRPHYRQELNDEVFLPRRP